ncbi:hypothetical protein Bca4012_094589 [Brassica carinata]|uniref:(rape) hypothetical protein n=1 Tax=Brassica napus TaxID=3708 RepID=A0A078IKK9_BRANA|nr:unnamed protein product [Brassica napus]CDY50521.1 BnaAnng10500D [Brassica napus]
MTRMRRMEIAAADSLYKAKLIRGFDDVDGMGTATWRSGKSPAYFKRGDYVLVLKVDASSPRSYPKSLHMSMSLAPSASDPTSTRKSVMTSQSCVNEQLKQLLVNQNPGKATSILSRQKENGSSVLVLNIRPTKSSHLEKRRSGSSTIRSSSYGLKRNNTAENKQTKGEDTLAEKLEGLQSLLLFKPKKIYSGLSYFPVLAGPEGLS